ncbi:MAG: tetratricopeptide repeat protein [Anaerolineae bacterium]|nr:tetratricopeptide repeat protein [Anaerolineae bacterium]
MKRRKNKPKRTDQSAADLRRNGLRAFQQGQYAAAVQIWERIPNTLVDPRLQAALAEGYFRLSHTQKEPQQRYQFSQKAAALQPGDPLYQYHLGLAAHKQKLYPEAITAYEKVLTNQTLAPRVAYPLALALAATAKSVKNHPVWQHLTAEQQLLLEQIQKRPFAPTLTTPLWQGVAAAQEERYPDAAALLQQASHNSHEAPLAHLMLGNIAARQEAWEQAIHHWQEAVKRGLRPQNLPANLSEVSCRLAEARLQQGNVEGAVGLSSLLNPNPGDKGQNELSEYLLFCKGYLAARQGNFAQAQQIWTSLPQGGGGSLRLAYNIALVYEKNDLLYEAAEQWREVLRRRPRKADHPDALNNEQVSRLYRRAAQAYNRVEEYDKAIQVYKNAVKWESENLALRLDLVDCLFENGQVSAALNEIDRILDRSPDHIPALLKGGEIHAQTNPPWEHNPALSYWEKVLAIAPDHAQARQQLSLFWQDAAESNYFWAPLALSIEMLQKAAAYAPNDLNIQVKIAEVYFATKEIPKALAIIEPILQMPQVEFKVLERILSNLLHGQLFDQANALINRIETNFPVERYQFYIPIAQNCLEIPREDVAETWLEKAVAAAPPGFPIYLLIGKALIEVNNETARSVATRYLHLALKHNQAPAEVRLYLGIAAAKNGDRKSAEQEWRTARKLARRNGDQALLAQIQRAELMFGGLPSFLDGMMPPDLHSMPPQLRQMFMNILGGHLPGGFFDEDDDEF